MRLSVGHAVALCFFLLTACRSSETRLGEVWAVVNGKPIQRADVERQFRRQMGGLASPMGEEEALSHQLRLLGELIQREILLQKAAQRDALATDSQIETAMNELQAPYAPAEFQRQLEMQGMTVAELREELRRELSVRNLFERELAVRTQVDDVEVVAYYNAHPEQFRNVETVFHVTHILVTPRAEPQIRNLQSNDAVGEVQARQKIEYLFNRLRAGGDFADLARNFSEDPNTALAGGDLGFFPESALAQSDAALRSIVRTLTVGATSAVVRSRDGYHIVKLIDRQPAGQRDVAEPEVRESIREHLRKQKQALLEAAYIETARNQARVVNNLARQILESGRALP